MNKFWYKNAVIYSADVETFKDSDDDGIGDLQGMKNALTYLSSLGINCLWLLPIFDTPNKDNGYDVKDYYQVDPRLGDLGHFAQLIDAAEEVGIRVLIDLAVNHTSREHPWFQQAVNKKDSRYRDFYIWSEEKPEEDGENLMAGEGGGDSSWHYEKKAGAYYFHTFFPHQPDLNIANPEVQKEIFRIMHFWLKLGVSGFRIDAAPHMFNEKANAKFDEDPHEVFRNFREFVETHKKDAILLAEANLDPDQYKKFFGDEDQMHMLFNFYVNNYLFLAFAREDAASLAEAIKRMPELSEKEQMAIFLRNHDELNLDKLSKEEREEVFKAFAPKKTMRIFGRGIRRRLAPMFNNDRKKLELAYSLLFSLPGTPVLRYGQEIGMGEDLQAKGRKSVRTVMQWANEKNGGFSSAPREKLIRSVVSKGDFAYEKVNVNDQHRNPDSLLNWMGRIINFRKEFPEFGWGKVSVLETGNSKVLAHSRKSDKGFGLALHNFSGEEVKIRLDLKDPLDLLDIFGNIRYEPFNPESQEVKLTAYGYRWLHKRKVFL